MVKAMARRMRVPRSISAGSRPGRCAIVAGRSGIVQPLDGCQRREPAFQHGDTATKSLVSCRVLGDSRVALAHDLDRAGDGMGDGDERLAFVLAVEAAVGAR